MLSWWYYAFLNLAVFSAIRLGCLTTCFPAFVPFRFARVVAAYSEELRDLIAFSGRYLSPVASAPCVEGLPDFVRQFWFVQFLKLFWDFLRGITCSPRLPFYIVGPASELFLRTTVLNVRPCYRLLFFQKFSYAFPVLYSCLPRSHERQDRLFYKRASSSFQRLAALIRWI